MKKKSKIIIVLLLVLFLLTGCTKPLVNKKTKKPIKNEKTGQIVTENILCQPESKDLKKIYEQNKKDISKLQKCDKFQINSGKYEGLWNSLFVKPLAWFIIKLGSMTKNYGTGLIIAAVIIRIVIFPLTRKTAKQGELIKKAQPEIEKLEKKYKDKIDRDSVLKKSQEISMIYQKYNINPLASLLTNLIQFPLLFAFLEAINRVPAIFEQNFWSFHLGTSPYIGIRLGNWFYLILVIINAIFTFLTFSLNKGIGGESKQNNMMMISMGVLITVMSLFVPAALNLYWIVNSGFSLLDILSVKKKEVKA